MLKSVTILEENRVWKQGEGIGYLPDSYMTFSLDEVYTMGLKARLQLEVKRPAWREPLSMESPPHGRLVMVTDKEVWVGLGVGADLKLTVSRKEGEGIVWLRDLLPFDQLETP